MHLEDWVMSRTSIFNFVVRADLEDLPRAARITPGARPEPIPILHYLSILLNNVA